MIDALRPALAVEGETGLLAMILAVAVLLVAAKLFGDLSIRVGQPAVLGELVAGLLLGPSLLNVMSLPVLQGQVVGEMVHILGQMGVILLMFAAGLEVELADMRKSGAPSLLGGTLGVLFPLGLGYLGGVLFGYSNPDSIFLGITLSATSVSISAQTLLDLGRLRTREGVALLGAAVIDDVLVIVSLSVFVALAAGGGTVVSIAAQLGRMAAIIVAVAGLSVFVLPRIADWSVRLRSSESLLALTLGAVFVLAWLAEYVGGVAAITGAFLAGVGLGPSHLKDEIERGLHRIAYAFFVPLFLVDIGLQANVRQLGGVTTAFVIAVIVIAVVSKVLGSGLGALLGGFSRGESFRMGLGMISRGEVGLIVAGVGVNEGLLDADLFALVVLMVLVTTLITPPLLRWAFARKEVTDAAPSELGGA